MYVNNLLQCYMFFKVFLQFVGEQNLGLCGGLRYNVSSTIRPRRGNHRETSQLTIERVSIQRG